MRARRRGWMGWLGLGVALLAAVAIVVALSSGHGRRSVRHAVAEPPSKPAPTTVMYGVNVNDLFDDGSYSEQQINTQLEAVHGTGASIVRTDALWERAEPQPPRDGKHSYDWTFDDAIASALARQRLAWLPIIDYSPQWSHPLVRSEHVPPASDADYAAFAQAFAARYGAGGTFWRDHPDVTADPVETFEIWNEPDNEAFWLPAPDPARYAALYESARAAIVVADPSARVIVGGISHRAFLRSMLAARPGLLGHLDGVAIHPYAPTPRAVLRKVAADRAELRRLGLGATPLYVTEVGWATRPPGNHAYAPARLRPGYLATTLLSLAQSGCGVVAVTVYTWVTPERDPLDLEDWYGIATQGRGSSADVAAFTTAIRAAASAGALSGGCDRRR